MAKRQLHVLTARGVQSKGKPGYYADGGGLYLQVSRAGTKSWLFRFSRDGRAREMGLGPLHAVSLAQARDKALGCRQLLAEGSDPIDARTATATAVKLAEARSKTFRECAEAFIASNRSAWKNAKHVDQWETTLESYCYGKLGSLPVSAIDTTLVMEILEPIWQTKTDTAKRVRGRVETVLNWAKARGLREGSNPAQWRGHLDQLLPRPSKVRKVRHHPALPYAAAAAFVQDLRAQPGVAARALEFIIFTVARTNEVLGARPGEISAHSKVWTVPAERMKAGKEHRVPLSARALELATLSSTGDFVFESSRSKGALSNMACLAVLKRMKRSDLTVHGFRSTFRDWAAEQTNFPREVVEAALAHSIDTKTEAAYRRGDFFEKRRRLMEAWSEYLSSVRSSARGNVTPLKPARESSGPRSH